MLKLSAIALLSAAALLHVTEAHSAAVNMDTVEGMTAAMSQSMYTCEQYLGADHFPNVEVLHPLSKKSAEGIEIIDVNYLKPYQKLIQQCSMQAITWSREHPSVDNWGDDKYLDEYASNTKADLRHAADYTKRLLEDAAQAEAGKKVAAEAVRQEQVQQAAQPKQAVKAYNIIEVIRDPILKDQLHYCESQPDLEMIITQAREEYQGAMAIYNANMKQMLQGGFTMQDVDAQVGDIRTEANREMQFQTQRIKKLANRCTIAEFGWKQK